ncbi:MAG: type I DNA topoisomerase [Candidatus Promineifilaceae bacterium]
MTEEIILETYCFKCKQKRQLQNPLPQWAANGSPGTRGQCPVCGSNIYSQGYTPAHDSLPKPVVTSTPGKKKTRKRNTKKRATKKKTVSRSGNLVVVESPTKARTIGRYLGRNYKVMSSVGHVRDLLRSRLSVDVENDFQPEYRVPNEKRDTVKELKAASAKAKRIFLATDLDREGEAIAWHVMESAEMDPSRTSRVEFQEITKPAIAAAFENPREIDMDRVNAQQARRILDRLVGYSLSPLLWRKIHGRLSAGRVQSVAVRLIVEREREIRKFVTEEYWTIGVELSQQKHASSRPRPFFEAKLRRIDGIQPTLQSEADVKPHLEELENAAYTVQDLLLGKRTRKPSAPYTTSTLQQSASRRLNFGTSKTMRIAQQLYEGIDLGGSDGAVGLITYMRTDSVNVAKQAQDEAREFIRLQYGDDYVPNRPPIYKSQAKAAQEAHEAIRPTAVAHSPQGVRAFLTRDQLRLYRLIWNRFVASQMNPAIYDTVRVDIAAGSSSVHISKRPYSFRATGSTLRFAGFLALRRDLKDSNGNQNDDVNVPSDLEKAEDLDKLRLLPEQHFTQPPRRFSEASLVNELESNGIGRPSTYASIISTIQARGYVELQEKRLAPTEIGELVNDMLVEYFPDVMSVDFTARLEGELDDIAGGKPWVPIIDEFYSRFSERLEVADKAISKVDVRTETEPVGRDCPLCGNPLVYRNGRYGRFVGCSNFPKCRHTEQILDKIGIECPQDGGDVVRKYTRKRKVFYGCSNYPDCDWTSWRKPIEEPCKFCGGLLVQVNSNNAECTKCGERQLHSSRQPASESKVSTG